MCDGLHVQLLVMPLGPKGAITGILPDGSCRMVFAFVPTMRFR
jgi:hypothetical protein